MIPTPPPSDATSAPDGVTPTTTLRRCTRRTATQIDDPGQGLRERIRGTLSMAVVAVRAAMTDDDPGPPALITHVTERLAQRLTAGGRALSPLTTAMVVLVTMPGLAAAQTDRGGLCGTPAIALFEWAAQTGAGALFLGGLVYGGFKHARAGMTRNPEQASLHRRTGTMAMIAGPIFGIIIVLGEQAAAAAGFTVAQCAHLTPWF